MLIISARTGARQTLDGDIEIRAVTPPAGFAFTVPHTAHARTELGLRFQNLANAPGMAFLAGNPHSLPMEMIMGRRCPIWWKRQAVQCGRRVYCTIEIQTKTKPEKGCKAVGVGFSFFFFFF